MNKEIAVNKIKPNDYNPNEMTKAEYAECKKEIKHLKRIPKPIIIRQAQNSNKFIIIDGEHNWKAAKELGFSTVPCEILKIETIEAMRQTYKRNMHGTFNKIKLARMFKRVMKENGLSLRKLAQEYNISDGTVRNTLLYLKAKELRNSYAFENLTIRQIRLYTELPSVIRDKWLDAGADMLILMNKEEIDWVEGYTGEKVETGNFENAMKIYKDMQQGDVGLLDKFQELYKTGLADKIKATPEGFQKSIKEIKDFCSWEYYKISFGPLPRPMEGKTLRKFTMYYYNVPHQFRYDFERLFKLIYFEGKFQITPEEFETTFEDGKKFGCKPGYAYNFPQYGYMRDAIQVILAEKGILNDSVDVEDLPNPAEELAKLKFNKNAPDYLKNLNIPMDIKIGIMDYKPSDVEGPMLEGYKKTLVESFGDLSERRWWDLKKILRDLDDMIAANQINMKYKNTTEEDMALSIIKLCKLYKDNQKNQSTFKAKLLQLTKEELHRIEGLIAWTDWAINLRNAIGARDRQREDMFLKQIIGV